LFQQHIAETWIGLVDANRVHELLDMMIHGTPMMLGMGVGHAPFEVEVPTAVDVPTI
jgi:hypothetical protein